MEYRCSLIFLILYCASTSAVEYCGRGLDSIGQAVGGQYSSSSTGFSYIDCSATGAIRNTVGTLTYFDFYTYDTQPLYLQLWRTTGPPNFMLIYEQLYTPRTAGNQRVTVNWAVQANDRGGFYYENAVSVPIPYRSASAYYSFQYSGRQIRAADGFLQFETEPSAKQFLFNFCEDDAVTPTPPPPTPATPAPTPSTGLTGCFGYTSTSLINAASVFTLAEQGPIAFVDNEVTAPNRISGTVAQFQFFASGTGTITLQIYRKHNPPSEMTLIGQQDYTVTDPTPRLHSVPANIPTLADDRVGFTIRSGGTLMMRKVLQADAYCSVQRDLSQLTFSPARFVSCTTSNAMRFPIQACTGNASPTPPTPSPATPSPPTPSPPTPRTTAQPPATPPPTNPPQSTPSTPPPPPGPTTTQVPAGAESLIQKDQERTYIIVGVSVGAYVLLIILISIAVCVGVKSNDSKPGRGKEQGFEQPPPPESPKLRENPLYSDPTPLRSEPEGYSSLGQADPPPPVVEYHTESLNRTDSYQAKRDSFKVRDSTHSDSIQADVSYSGSFNQPTNMVIEENPSVDPDVSYQGSLYARGSTRPVSARTPTPPPAAVDEDDGLLHSNSPEPQRQASVKEIRERFASLERQHEGYQDSGNKEAVLAEMRSRFSTID